MASELEGKQLLPLHLGASTADKFLLEANAVKYLGAKSEDAASVEDALTALFAAVGGDGVVASVSLNDEGTQLIVEYADTSTKTFNIKQTEIVDNLTSDSTEAALSAAQGKALKGLIDSVNVKNLVAGNGIKLVNNDGEWTISIPVTDADGFLTADASGLKLTGVKTAIDDAVKVEADRAKAAEKVNSDAIAVLNGDSATAGSVAKAVADAKSELIGDAAAEYNTLGKLEDKIQEVDAKASAAHTKVNAKADGHVTVAVAEKTTAEGVAYSEVTVAEDDIASAADLTEEIERAKAAEKANADAITILNGEETVKGSVKKVAKSYADNVKNILITIPNLTTWTCDYTFEELKNLIDGDGDIPTFVVRGGHYIVSDAPDLFYSTHVRVINSTWIGIETYTNYNDKPIRLEVFIKSDGTLYANEDGLNYLATTADIKTYSGSKAITVADTTISLNINANDKVLSQDADGLLSTLSLEYDSTDKKIYLYGKDNSSTTNAISTIDATDFIKDGMLDSASFDATTHVLTLTFNTESGKEAINVDLTSLVDTYKAGYGLLLADDGTFSVGDISSKYLSTEKGGHISGGDVIIDDALQATEVGVTKLVFDAGSTNEVSVERYSGDDVDYLQFNSSYSSDGVNLRGIATPTDDSDAANKSYVDSKVDASLNWIEF